jgi:hypothetical protein
MGPQNPDGSVKRLWEMRQVAGDQDIGLGGECDRQILHIFVVFSMYADLDGFNAD